jgi:hypothetical protein
MNLDVARGLVRPFVTCGLTLLVAYLAITEKIEASEVIALYGPILGFWFGARKNDTAKT